MRRLKHKTLLNFQLILSSRNFWYSLKWFVVNFIYICPIHCYLELKEWIVGKADSDFYCWKNQRTAPHNVFLSKFSWLKSLIFHPFSKHTRNSACILVKSMMKDKMREKLFIDLLFSYISDVSCISFSCRCQIFYFLDNSLVGF